jgi:hypothetical protein
LSDAFLGEVGVVGSLNFEGRPFRFAKKDHPSFYLDETAPLPARPRIAFPAGRN